MRDKVLVVLLVKGRFERWQWPQDPPVTMRCRQKEYENTPRLI